jgi:hypothetical protein
MEKKYLDLEEITQVVIPTQLTNKEKNLLDIANLIAKEIPNNGAWDWFEDNLPPNVFSDKNKIWCAGFNILQLIPREYFGIDGDILLLKSFETEEVFDISDEEIKSFFNYLCYLAYVDEKLRRQCIEYCFNTFKKDLKLANELNNCPEFRSMFNEIPIVKRK